MSGGAIAANVVYIHQLEDETTHGRDHWRKEAVEQKLEHNSLKEKVERKVAAVRGKIVFSIAKKV